MCDYLAHAVPPERLRLRGEHLLQQLDDALASPLARPPVDQIDLLTLGSFFHPREVDAEARRMLLGRVARQPGVRRVLVESRAAYITAAALRDARECLTPRQQLEVGLGVESANEAVRNGILNKGLGWDEVERVVRTCAAAEVGFLAYLLVKPHGLSEAEALADAVVSARQVAALCRAAGAAFRIAFEPVFVTRNTVLNDFYQRGEYRCCSLWTVVEVLRRCHGLGTLFVGLSDEGLAGGRVPRNCPACDSRVRDALEQFNAEQDPAVFEDLDCGCRLDWLANLSPESDAIPAGAAGGRHKLQEARAPSGR
jgi:radical SAM enzyme (TIGR01210 family)